jgi:3-dehydroquinate synthase class II
LVVPSAEPTSQQPETEQQANWKTISVTELKPGDAVLVHQQAAARHTGIEVVERIVEQ